MKCVFVYESDWDDEPDISDGEIVKYGNITDALSSQVLVPVVEYEGIPPLNAMKDMLVLGMDQRDYTDLTTTKPMLTITAMSLI
jgi:hypothetical protein